MLWADPEDHLAPLVQARPVRQGQAGPVHLHHRHAALFAHHARQQVHGRRADEARDKDICRPVIQLQRGPHLGDMAVAHHHDAVGHGHRLDLVMGHVNRRGAQPLMQFADFRPHLHAQLGIQVRQRLVEQKHLRVAYNGAAHRHALALPAGKLARIARKIGLQPKDICRAIDLRGDLRLVHALHLQGKAHVRCHRLVGVKRIVLEHHGNVPVRRRQVVDHPIPDADRPRGDAFQPGDHAQKR